MTPSGAKLVWITPNAEHLLAHCARVSNPAGQASSTEAGDARLLRYCLRKGHWSVFEMASACVEIECTRAISRQILRHRSFSFQEFSTRYAAVDADPVWVQPRRQDTKNRQNSIDDLPAGVRKEFALRQVQVWNQAAQAYRDALRAGVAKECARALLPEGLTPSRIYMAGTVRSWLHYLHVRLDSATQAEHRKVAQAVAAVLQAELPTVWEAAFGNTKEVSK